jgi:hydrogenase expression/formation protein HypC
MCLAVPGQVVKWVNRDPLFASAEVEFGAVRRVCSMACVPEVNVGQYVIVHAGIAISRIDEDAARRTLADLASLDESPAPRPGVDE